MTSVACAVLAAGESRRLGSPKQLVELAGVPLVRRVVDQAEASRCAHVSVVIGAHELVVRAALRDARATCLQNRAWQQGLSSSVHMAVEWAQSLRCAGLLLAVADQPFLTARHLDLLLDAFLLAGDTVASSYGGRLGVPALFARSWYRRLLRLGGDCGASALLREQARLSVPFPDGDIDIDTPDDLAAVRELLAMRDQ